MASTYTHTYASAGKKTITLELSDSQGLKDTETAEVTAVANVPPTADFTSTVSGRTVSVTSTSTDSDGRVSSYQWNFG